MELTANTDFTATFGGEVFEAKEGEAVQASGLDAKRLIAAGLVKKQPAKAKKQGKAAQDER